MGSQDCKADALPHDHGHHKDYVVIHYFARWFKTILLASDINKWNATYIFAYYYHHFKDINGSISDSKLNLEKLFTAP